MSNVESFSIARLTTKSSSPREPRKENRLVEEEVNYRAGRFASEVRDNILIFESQRPTPLQSSIMDCVLSQLVDSHRASLC